MYMLAIQQAYLIVIYYYISAIAYFPSNWECGISPAQKERLDQLNVHGELTPGLGMIMNVEEEEWSNGS